ncbi:hypothetical protein MNV49_007168 [Pseudohyphozyma bogoriensis]|nr:hypothetical protein MNV49_007168 [Pseudohyphozyma bogoriensis]
MHAPPPSTLLTNARPSASLTSLLRTTFHSRPFSTSSPTLVRPTYYQGGGGQRYGGSRRPQSPWESWRQRLDAVPNAYVLWTLLGVNIAVFFTWQYGTSVWQTFRDPSWLVFLNKNFTVSWANISSGRFWTLLTSCFSHEGTGHIVMNMLSLYFIAPAMLAFLGNGIAASAFSLAFHHFIDRSRMNYTSHGASGAVYGILSYFAARNPQATFLLFFVIPAPAWAIVSGIFFWDLYSSFNSRRGRTDSAGHVGGITAGLLWFFRRRLGF